MHQLEFPYYQTSEWAPHFIRSKHLFVFHFLYFLFRHLSENAEKIGCNEVLWSKGLLHKQRTPFAWRSGYCNVLLWHFTRTKEHKLKFSPKWVYINFPMAWSSSLCDSMSCLINFISLSVCHCAKMQSGDQTRHHWQRRFVVMSLMIFCLRFGCCCERRKFHSKFPIIYWANFLEWLNERSCHGFQLFVSYSSAFCLESSAFLVEEDSKFWENFIRRKCSATDKVKAWLDIVLVWAILYLFMFLPSRLFSSVHSRNVPHQLLLAGNKQNCFSRFLIASITWSSEAIPNWQ